MKKQKSAGRSKLLILLIGLICMAILAIAVLWPTHFMKNGVPVAQAPEAKRIKILQPPQESLSQPPVEPVQSQPSETPADVVSLPEETPSQEPVAAQPVEPPLPAITEASEPQDGAAHTAASMETPEPVSGTSAPAEVSKVRPAEEPSVDSADRTPSEPATAQPATDTGAGTVHFNLQVGAFREKTYAIDTMEKLSKSGYDPFILEITDSRQRIWYTVRIGRYGSHAEAVSALDRLERKENIMAIIAKAIKQ